MRTVATCLIITLAGLLAAPAGARAAITITDGGSFLNDFEMLGRWESRPATSGYRNTPGLAYVQEGETGYLYAHSRGGSSTYLLRKWELPAVGAGVAKVTQIATRTGSQQALAYSPNYEGGALWSHSTYLTTGYGLTDGGDGDYITEDVGDTPLSDSSKTSAWYYNNGDGTFLPGQYSPTGNDGFLIVRNGGGTPEDQLVLLEPNTATDPDTWDTPQLAGRSTNADLRSVLLNLTTELGIQNVIGVQFADYSAAGGLPTLYIFANATGATPDPYHLIVLTPGDDGVFGESTPGVSDDLAVGYTFGEPGNGNDYQVQKQHITGEDAEGDSTLVDIDGSYSTGFQASAFDPNSGYFYLHGAGDYGTGIIMMDISDRTFGVVPEPATMGLLALGGVGLLLKRRRKA